MRSGEKTRVIGDDGHFGAVVARLVKHAILEYHEYIRILFESGVKVPIVALGLWGGAVKPLGNLSPVLLQMDGLTFMESDSQSKLSRVVGLELTQLGGLYMENKSRHLRRVNSSFSPLYSSTNIVARAARESRPFRSVRHHLPHCSAT